MPLPELPLFFDGKAEFSVTAGHLPHWEQRGTVCFITFRTWDSLPRAVVDEFLTIRNEWLRSNGVDPHRPDWALALSRLSAAQQSTFRRLCSTRWNNALDDCHGSCPLRSPTCAQVVADSLRHFDEDRYALFDFVVMPNHVHVLASFPERGAMRKQCESWKHYTATRLNRLLSRTGRFWEEESFDHLVRSEAQFEQFREYIVTNPRNANLRTSEFVHYSRNLDAPLTRGAPLAERADHSNGARP
ncbi:MAG: transposase [Planctomycetes bacterium]|nr:transposase [Planctomycetota bacterium]